MITPETIRKILDGNRITVSDQQWHQLTRWVELLLEANQSINLISRKHVELIWEQQLLHCLSLLAVRIFPETKEVCDFGSGGGLPGIPLAIVRPELNWVLIDATQKKIKVVEQLKEKLGLNNVQPVWGRGEDLGTQEEFKNRFSVFTARGVSQLENLEKWTRTLRTERALMYVYKGGDLKEERDAIRKNRRIYRVKDSLIDLKGYPGFTSNEKKIISIYFGKS